MIKTTVRMVVKVRYTLSVKKKKKKTVKSDQLCSGDHYFFSTNNFTRLKLTPTKISYQLFFLLNKTEILKILKKLSDLLHINLVEWHLVGKGS